MPTPRAGESHDDFLTRFHEKMSGEFPDSKQRHAVGENQWRSAKKAVSEDDLTTGMTVGGPGHEHRYQVNARGFGRTGMEEGHWHPVMAFLVVQAPDGHGHALDRVFEGFMVEREHGPNALMRMKTALDHLLEHPDYYERLKAAGL